MENDKPNINENKEKKSFFNRKNLLIIGAVIIFLIISFIVLKQTVLKPEDSYVLATTDVQATSDLEMQIFNIKSTDEQMKFLSDRIEKNSSDYIAYGELAVIIRMNNNNKHNNESLSYLDKSYEINPDFYLANREKGEIAFQESNYEESSKYFKKATEAGEFINAGSFAMYGLSEIRMGNFEEGIPYVEKALLTHSDFNHWRYELALAYYNISDYDNAKKHAELIIENSKERPNPGMIRNAQILIEKTNVE